MFGLLHSDPGEQTAATLKLSQFFVQWIRSESSHSFVRSLIDDANNGSLTVKSTLGMSFVSPGSPMTPPLSPTRTRSGAELELVRRQLYPGSPLKMTSGRLSPPVAAGVGLGKQPSILSKVETISVPRIWPLFDNKLFVLPLKQERESIEAFLAGKSRLTITDVEELLGILNMPLWLSPVVFAGMLNVPVIGERVKPIALFDSDASVDVDVWISYYEAIFKPFPTDDRRLFNILASKGRVGPIKDRLSFDDFVPFLLQLVRLHPGLQFLVDSEQFQIMYVQTVILRIFWELDLNRDGQILPRDIANSHLLQCMVGLDSITSIDTIPEGSKPEHPERKSITLTFFYYEHFYIIYCMFWQLDTCHALSLPFDDFLRYDNATFSPEMARKIFDYDFGYPISCFSDFNQGMIDRSVVDRQWRFVEWVYFILAARSPTKYAAKMFWFGLCDQNGDGLLCSQDLFDLWEANSAKVADLLNEAVAFEDVLCQAHDMIQPADEFRWTLDDILKAVYGGDVCQFFIDSNKFVNFECRDPITARLADEIFTDWDRYAAEQYANLAAEDQESADTRVDYLEDTVFEGIDFGFPEQDDGIVVV